MAAIYVWPTAVLLLSAESSGNLITFDLNLLSGHIAPNCVVQYDANSVSVIASPALDLQQISTGEFDPSLVASSRCLLRVEAAAGVGVAEEMNNLRVEAKAMATISAEALDGGTLAAANFDIFGISLGNGTGDATVMFKSPHGQDFEILNDKSKQRLSKKVAVRRPLRLSLPKFPPFVFLRGDGGEARHDGIDVALLGEIAAHLGRPVVHVPARLNGQAVDLVRRGQADVAGVTLILGTFWYRGTDFLPLNFHRVIGISTGLPGRRSRFQTLVEPFNWQVWLGVSISVSAVCAVLVAVQQWLAAADGDGEPVDVFLLSTVGYGVMICESLPARLLDVQRDGFHAVVLFVWVPLTCLLGMAYQSNLRAALIKKESARPLSTYQDLIDHDLTLYITEGTLVNFLLRTAPIPIVREAYQKLTVEKGGFYRFTDAGKAPDIVWDSAQANRGAFDSTDLRTVGQRHFYYTLEEAIIYSAQTGYYVAMKQDGMAELYAAMQRFAEAGLREAIEWRYVWEAAAPERAHYRSQRLAGDDDMKLGLGHIVPVNLVYGAMAAASIFTFMAELFCFSPSPGGKTHL